MPKAGFYEVAPQEDWPMLHQSVAHTLVSRSPLHAWHRHFAEIKEYTDATDRGELCHALLLGGKDIVTVEANDWRTNAAKEKRDEARAAGKIPVLSGKLLDAQVLADSVQSRLESEGLELTGQSELTAVWQSDGVWCQGRMDHCWIPARHLILDLKFTANASLRSCETHFYNFGYDIQHAAYIQAAEKNYPELAGLVKMLYVFVEVDQPHAIRIVPVGATMRRLGEWRWGRAVEMWRDCLERYGPNKPWPAYDDDRTPVEAPAWALAEQQIQDEIQAGGNL
ncbi:MAG: PD-(D/E)XK nuclease-like domain-containing protein [Candidatus Binatia bacterium]|nr:PD-(D/E)XK nuclease-like domain-containing protein [Candidatus Binatia bacterium]